MCSASASPISLVQVASLYHLDCMIEISGVAVVD